MKASQRKVTTFHQPSHSRETTKHMHLIFILLFLISIFKSGCVFVLTARVQNAK